MASAAPQTYANHKRIDPWYHYVGFGLVLVAVFLSAAHVVRHPHDHPGIGHLILALALLVTFLRLRIYALRIQDRVIRLEETVRMRALLPAALASRIGELKPGQFVALRFASDGELQARVEEALKEDLTGAAIKQRIQAWRPDTFRV